MEKTGPPPPPEYSSAGTTGNVYSPPGGYPQQSATVVVTGQPTVVPQQSFKEIPVRTKCPSCNEEIVTSTHYETGSMTWMVVGATCFISCWFCLCCVGLIPFCIRSLKDVVHTCPKCRFTVGKYDRTS